MARDTLRVLVLALAVTGVAGCAARNTKPDDKTPVPPHRPVVPAAAPGEGAGPPTREPVWLTWDLSQSSDIAAIGAPDSKQAMYPGDIDDNTQLWFWRGKGRVVIRLPRGRVIDSFAESLDATVKDGLVVGITFNTVGPPMDATELRRIMVRNINELHVRQGADAADAIRVLDRWIAESQRSPSTPTENFGSRDGEPSVDIRVAKLGDGQYCLVYDVYWFY